MSKPLKALAVVSMLTAVATMPARAEFGQTNAEKGCIILTLNTSTRVEDTPWMNSVGCAQLKSQTARATNGNDGWNTCTLGMLMLHNRMRGRPDFDKPSLEVRQNVVQGCLMLMDNLSEEQAKYIASRGVKE
jgi:hypothetical protein